MAPNRKQMTGMDKRDLSERDVAIINAVRNRSTDLDIKPAL